MVTPVEEMMLELVVVEAVIVETVVVGVIVGAEMLIGAVVGATTDVAVETASLQTALPPASE